MKCTGRNCPMQNGMVDPAHCLAADECLYVTKPLTNADCIRAMTDDDLSIFISEVKIDGLLRKFEFPSSAIDWLEWLKQEAQDAID